MTVHFVSLCIFEGNLVWATDLVSHDRLLNRSQVFEGRQEDMAPLSTTDILDEVAKLLAESNEDLVFVFDGLCVPVRLCSDYAARGNEEARGGGPSRKGISSSRVRSGPRARAIVERRLMAFRRRMTSSCWKSVLVTKGLKAGALAA